MSEKTAEKTRLIDQNNSNLRNILNELDLCNVSLDKKGKIIYVNDNFCALTNYLRAEIIGKDFFSLFCKEDKANTARQQFDECMKKQELKEAKRWDLRTKNGLIRSLHIHFIYDFNDDGQLTGISCIGRDTTEQNHTIEALHDNRMQMQDLIDNAYDLIHTVDQNYKFLFTNRAWQTRLGYTPEELEKMTLHDIVHPEHLESFTKQQQLLYQGKPHIEVETVFVTKKGDPLFLNGIITCQFHSNRPVATRAILHDETQRVKANLIQGVYYRIANLAISTSDLQSLYRGIHHELSRIIDTTNIYLALCNETSNEIYFPYYVDQHSWNTLENHRRPFKKGLTEYIVHTKKPLLATRKQIQDLAKQNLVNPFGVLPEVFMGSPLVIADRIIGVVAVQSSKSATAYTQQDLDVLHFISNQIALAIERKKNEEEIKNHKARLEAIFDSSSHVMWTVDRQLRLKSFNRNFVADMANAFDFGPSDLYDIEIYSKSFQKDPNLPIWIEKYALAFEGAPQHFIVELQLMGENSWREVFLNPIFLENGEFDEVSGIALDITEKQNKEIALIESEEKFRRIFESILDVYYRTDMDGIIQHMSPSVTETFGYSAEEVVGMHGSNFYHYSDDRELLIRTVIKHGKVRNYETSMVRKDGTIIQTMLNSRLITDADGKPIGIEGVAKDITELKETQAALIKAKEQAENLLKVKSQFLANMSHELRTPMNGIIGMIELLGQTEMHDEQRDYVETLRKSSEALLIILNDILDLSKIQAGKLDLNLTSIDLELCVEKIHSLFLNRAFQKGLNFTFEIRPDVPKYIKTDETRLLQILSNLVSNAIKFTNSGDVKVIVSLNNPKNGSLLFEVFDSGIGIKKESQHLLFNNFSQLDTSSSKTFAGTGLGLAISLQLTKLLGGTIGVDSDYGKGSRFWFTIRFSEPDEKDEVKLKIEEAPKKKTEKLNWQPQVLLVDDNPINQKVGAIMLQKLGCEVDIAENGFEAIEKAISATYDYIFMDIQMPGMDGVAATANIKSKLGNSCPPVIAMTAYSMKNDARRFISQGMDDYISKPVKQSDFQHVITTWKQKAQAGPMARLKTPATVINLDIVQQLKDLGGIDFALQLYTEFETEAEKLVSEIAKSRFKAKDKVILANLHQLKGTAGTLGLQKLSAQAKLLEENIRNGRTDNLNQELQVLLNLLQEYKNTYRDLFNYN